MKKHRNLMRVLALVAVMAVALSACFTVLRPKYDDGVYSFTVYYRQKKNTVDVLALGSSHIFEAFNTEVLWNDAGVAGYVLGASMQTLWGTYYFLEEALKTQSPQLVVVDAFGATVTDDYGTTGQIAKSLFGMRLSLTKLKAVWANAPAADRFNFLLQFPYYHSRYTEIDYKDFTLWKGKPEFYKTWKGFSDNPYQEPIAPEDVSGVTETVQLTEKTEAYLRKIIALCKERGIPLMLITTPYEITAADQKVYNRVREIADETGTPFPSTQQLVGDPGEYGVSATGGDFSDAHHLSYTGNVKFTRYLLAYMQAHYDLPDRRGLDGWDSWQESYDYWAANYPPKIPD